MRVNSLIGANSADRLCWSESLRVGWLDEARSLTTSTACYDGFRRDGCISDIHDVLLADSETVRSGNRRWSCLDRRRSDRHGCLCWRCCVGSRRRRSGRHRCSGGGRQRHSGRHRICRVQHNGGCECWIGRSGFLRQWTRRLSSLVVIRICCTRWSWAQAAGPADSCVGVVLDWRRAADRLGIRDATTAAGFCACINRRERWVHGNETGRAAGLGRWSCSGCRASRQCWRRKSPTHHREKSECRCSCCRLHEGISAPTRIFALGRRSACHTATHSHRAPGVAGGCHEFSSQIKSTHS